MTWIFGFAAILWYGVTAAVVAIGIYATIYFARLLDITRRQVFVALPVGIALSALDDAFKYVTSTHMAVYFYDDLFTYTVLTIGPIVVVWIVYFVFVAGRRNLLEKYNIDISGSWPGEIKRMKEARK